MNDRDDYPYPEDEFDTLGADRSPLGVHRAPLPRWRQWLPFLIVLILAPTLAFFAVRALRGGDDAGPEPTPTQATTVPAEPAETTEPGAEPTGEVSQEPTDAPSSEAPTTEAPAPVDYSTAVFVLNGAGVNGLAGDTVEVLDGAGWLDTTADDYGSAQPSSTTIYYDNAEQADEAAAIGETLGIATQVENSDAADGAIVIVLRSDFDLP